MKTAELTGAKLDYWAGKADNRNVRIYTEDEEKRVGIFLAFDSSIRLERYTPSTDWSQGGPIIERERIDTVYPPSHVSSQVFCYYEDERGIWGPTPLIAAMRCFVTSKFGDEVPEE